MTNNLHIDNLHMWATLWPTYGMPSMENKERSEVVVDGVQGLTVA